MNSKRTFFLVVAMVFSAAAAGHVSPARAALCGKCREMMFTESQGRCIDCGGPTSSGGAATLPQVQRQTASVRALFGRAFRKGRGRGQRRTGGAATEPCIKRRRGKAASASVGDARQCRSRSQG